MSDTAAANTEQDENSDGQVDNVALPSVSVSPPKYKTDFATLFGIVFSVGLISGAILLGQSNANFFNIPAVIIVVFGTIAATSISFTVDEIRNAGKTFGQSVRWRVNSPSKMATTLIDLAVIAKKKGVLGLSAYDDQLQKSAFLHRATSMVVDGYKPKDIDFLLAQEVDSLVERHKRSASIAGRASEVAPAMGLIGTLVGLVQMLADLENPDSIGPAMAVALLTTFYGAILGTVIMAPLAVKLEKRSRDEALIKNLIRIACVSIAAQENPRKLEMVLNSELPPNERIRYFD